MNFKPNIAPPKKVSSYRLSKKTKDRISEMSKERQRTNTEIIEIAVRELFANSRVNR